MELLFSHTPSQKGKMETLIYSGRLKILSGNFFQPWIFGYVTMVIPWFLNIYCVLTAVLFEIAYKYHIAWMFLSWMTWENCITAQTFMRFTSLSCVMRSQRECLNKDRFHDCGYCDCQACLYWIYWDSIREPLPQQSWKNDRHTCQSWVLRAWYCLSHSLQESNRIQFGDESPGWIWPCESNDKMCFQTSLGIKT